VFYNLGLMATKSFRQFSQNFKPGRISGLLTICPQRGQASHPTNVIFDRLISFSGFGAALNSLPQLTHWFIPALALEFKWPQKLQYA
jgi:hypothetical protein